MARKYTPEQKIINLRAKGEITHQEAARRIRALGRQEEAKANRGFLRRVLDFFTS